MISIIIPALNEEKFLLDCLNSLKKQYYKGKYEIILVDNNSIDNTKEIAKNFGIKIIRCSKKGVFYARKMGISTASGDIIIQADADTVYPKYWLSRISKQFSSHLEVVAVAGKFVYKDPPFWAGFEYLIRGFVNNLTLTFLRRPCLISGANFAFRKEAFLKVGGYDKKSLSFDQYDIARRLSKMGKVIYDKKITALTSSRRVQKPPIFVLRDFVLNLTNIFIYFLKSSSRTLIKSGVKLFLFLIVIIFFLYGYFVPVSSVFGKVYYKGDDSEKIIALTFDDGPNEPYTSKILDILDKYNVKVTFFVIGKNTEIYPETLKRMVDRGDVVENHSYSHNPNHALTINGCKDIEIGEQAIFNIIGLKPHIYRPPHGRKTPWELECLEKENLIEVEWSASTNELHSKLFFGKVSSLLLARNIIKEAGSGKIILLHDGYGICHNCKESDKIATVEALPIIIETLQNEGYKFVTVPQLLGVPAYNN